MNNKKETELNNAILLYICECQVSGDFMALRDLGIPSDIQEKLRNMTIQEVFHTSQISSSFIKSIEIDNVILGNLLDHAGTAKRSKRKLDQLIAHGAPLQLVKDLEGVTPLEFSTIRKMQNVGFRGRTQQPTDDEVTAIFSVCDEMGINVNKPGDLTADQWIEMADKTSLTIRVIYKVICECEEINRERIERQ